MAMDLQRAFTYPFKKENWMNTLVIPGGIFAVTAVINLLVGIIGFILTLSLGAKGSTEAANSSKLLIDVIHIIASIPIAIILIPVHGYYWNLVNNWQTNGWDAPAPAWKDNIKDYCIDGLHYYLVGIVLFIPTIISLCSLGFLFPFVWAPIFSAAKERRIGAVLNNMSEGFSIASSRYLSILGIMWLIVGISVLSIIPSFILSLTIVGGAVLTNYLYVVSTQLLTQAYTPDSAVAFPVYQKPPVQPQTAPPPSNAPTTNSPDDEPEVIFKLD